MKTFLISAVDILIPSLILGVAVSYLLISTLSGRTLKVSDIAIAGLISWPLATIISLFIDMATSIISLAVALAVLGAFFAVRGKPEETPSAPK